MKRVAIIGAGAAGCFCAAQLRSMAPEMAVTVFEAGSKPLAKVAITGGGRCNLTNDFQGIRSLSEAYPRGERVMKRALKAFSNDDTIRWFSNNGVPCVLQPDHCWFPQSQDAMDVVRCLLRAMKGADIRLNTKITSIRPTAEENYFSQGFAKNQFSSAIANPTHDTNNHEGPTAEGIYFLQGFAKNQIPSAIANPTRINDNPEGPTAEGIYFSQGFAKNQIPSAIANPTRIGSLSLLRKEVKHQLTHRTLIVDFYLWEPAERPELPEGYVWIKETELDRYGKPRLFELLLESLP